MQNIKHGRYFHSESNFWSIHFHAKGCNNVRMLTMFYVVSTLFSYERAY